MKRKKSDTGVQRKSAKVHASTLIGTERDHSPQDVANMPVQLILCCWDLCCQTDSFTWYFPPIQTVSSRCFTDSGRESRIRTRRRKSPPMDIRDGDGGNHPFSSCALGSCQWQALGAGTAGVLQHPFFVRRGPGSKPFRLWEPIHFCASVFENSGAGFFESPPGVPPLPPNAVRDISPRDSSSAPWVIIYIFL